MKATRKLIPALAMLLVAAVVMSSASYAWFTMSRQVTAQGMNVTVTAPNNLMIKPTGVDNDSDYAEIAKLTASDIVLVPASSTSGKAGQIYCVAPGQAVKPSSGALYDDKTLLMAGTEATSTNEGAYYDFKYTIKSDGDQPVSVVVSSVTAEINTVKPGQTGKSAKPVRIAVMKDDENGLCIFNPNNGEHHNVGQAVASLNKTQDSDLTGLAVLDAVEYKTPAQYNNDGNVIVTLNNGNNFTANIIIRVWYEGEDKDCIVAKGANANFDITVVLADVASLDAPASP